MNFLSLKPVLVDPKISKGGYAYWVTKNVENVANIRSYVEPISRWISKSIPLFLIRDKIFYIMVTEMKKFSETGPQKYEAEKQFSQAYYEEERDQYARLEQLKVDIKLVDEEYKLREGSFRENQLKNMKKWYEMMELVL